MTGPKKQIALAALSPNELRRFFRDAYRDAGFVQRQLAAWRPSICPYPPLLRWIPQQSHVLDFGCGSGTFLSVLAATGWISSGVGCDVSDKAIKVARLAQSRLSNDVLTFHCVENLEALPPGPFDAVIMVDVLHHVPTSLQHRAVLAAVERVKPGGRLIYKDMASRPAWRRLANTAHDLLLARQWIQYVPIATVEQWLRAAGMKELYSRNYVRWCYGHELRVFGR